LRTGLAEIKKKGVSPTQPQTQNPKQPTQKNPPKTPPPKQKKKEKKKKNPQIVDSGIRRYQLTCSFYGDYNVLNKNITSAAL